MKKIILVVFVSFLISCSGNAQKSEKKVSKKKEQEKKPASSKTIKYIVIANVKENGKFFLIFANL